MSELRYSGIIKVDGKTAHFSETNFPSCFPLTREKGEWKITFPSKREKKNPTKK